MTRENCLPSGASFLGDVRWGGGGVGGRRGGSISYALFSACGNLETMDRFEKREIKFSLVFSIGVNPFLEGEIMGGGVP